MCICLSLFFFLCLLFCASFDLYISSYRMLYEWWKKKMEGCCTLYNNNIWNACGSHCMHDPASNVISRHSHAFIAIHLFIYIFFFLLCLFDSSSYIFLCFVYSSLLFCDGTTDAHIQCTHHFIMLYLQWAPLCTGSPIIPIWLLS